MAPARDGTSLSLSEQAGARLLERLLEGASGATPVTSTLEQRMQISRAMRGHAPTLQLLGSYIRHGLGDVRRWREIDFEGANEEHGGHAFRVIQAYARLLAGPRAGQRQLAALKLLGLFDRPADPGCIEVLRRSPAIRGLTEPLVDLDAQGWRSLVSSLEQMQLITCRTYEPGPVLGYDKAAAKLAGELDDPPGAPQPWPSRELDGDAVVIDAHSLVREYSARELEKSNPAAWREGHLRVYQHLCESVPYWPEGFEGLQPLYQAIAHGCHADRLQEACTRVFHDRVFRGGARCYSSKILGAYDADLRVMACFFDRAWDRPSSKLSVADQAWVLSVASFFLCNAGRSSEALAPMREGLDRQVGRGDWKNATIAAGNLSELELTLGQTSAAIEDAVKSVEYADRGESEGMRIFTRTTLADARHQAGDESGARELFERAEAMHAEYAPSKPRLYSLQGHRYAELLLRPVERAAWRAVLGEATDNKAELLPRCAEVFDRALRALEIARQRRLLQDIGLGHLTLGRTALYAATISPGNASAPELRNASAREHLDAAVDNLRKASQLPALAAALISCAWQCHATDPDRARANLDEASAIAARGPMPIVQADLELTRARLFHDRNALAIARTLITRHAYNRRLGELADAEQAARV